MKPTGKRRRKPARSCQSKRWLWMLFAARILAGILSSATAPTTMAYVSDSTPKDKRGGGMRLPMYCRTSLACAATEVCPQHLTISQSVVK